MTKTLTNKQVLSYIEKIEKAKTKLEQKSILLEFKLKVRALENEPNTLEDGEKLMQEHPITEIKQEHVALSKSIKEIANKMIFDPMENISFMMDGKQYVGNSKMYIVSRQKIDSRVAKLELVKKHKIGKLLIYNTNVSQTCFENKNYKQLNCETLQKLINQNDIFKVYDLNLDGLCFDNKLVKQTINKMNPLQSAILCNGYLTLSDGACSVHFLGTHSKWASKFTR